MNYVHPSLRNCIAESGAFFLGHPIYICIYNNDYIDNYIVWWRTHDVTAAGHTRACRCSRCRGRYRYWSRLSASVWAEGAPPLTPRCLLAHSHSALSGPAAHTALLASKCNKKKWFIGISISKQICKYITILMPTSLLIQFCLYLMQVLFFLNILWDYLQGLMNMKLCKYATIKIIDKCKIKLLNV